MGKYKRIDFCKGVFGLFFKEEKEKALKRTVFKAF